MKPDPDELVMHEEILDFKKAGLSFSIMVAYRIDDQVLSTGKRLWRSRRVNREENTLKVNTRYEKYLSICCTKWIDDEDARSGRRAVRRAVYISYPHLFKFQNLLNQAAQWFDSLAVILNPADYYKVSDLGGGKSIVVIPIVKEKELKYIRFLINEPEFNADLTLEQFITVWTYFKNFNLHIEGSLVLQNFLMTEVME